MVTVYMPVLCVWCRWPDSAILCRFHRCSSWMRLLSLRQEPWSRQCKLSGKLQFIEGRRHPCLYAEAISHGPDCCRTQEIPQFVDTWPIFLLCGSCRFSGAAEQRIFLLSQPQLAEKIVARCVQPQVLCGSACRKLRKNPQL